MNFKKKSKKTTLSRVKKDIFDIGNESIFLIRIVVIVVGLFFTYLAINNPFKKLFSEQISEIEFSLVFKLLCILIFYSKSYGATIDIKELQRELIKIKFSKIPVKIYMVSVAYIIIYIFLLFQVDDFLLFSTSLILLKIIYMLFWQQSTPFFLQNIKETFIQNVKESKEIEKLQNKILNTYFIGHWVKDSANAVLIPCTVAIILSLTNYSNDIQSFFNINSENLLPSILIFIGFIISELIIWTKRLKRKYQIRYLDANYDLIIRRLKSK